MTIVGTRDYELVKGKGKKGQQNSGMLSGVESRKKCLSKRCQIVTCGKKESADVSTDI